MSADDKYRFLDEGLNRRKELSQYRTLTPGVPLQPGLQIKQGEDEFANFCSNDYLGLAQHPAVIAQARAYLDKYGTGATASRLVTGTYEIHTKLEDDIAAMFGKPSALIFNSGFQANSSLLATITDRHSLILSDKLSHNSLLQGGLAARATFQRFNHNNTEHLEALLKKAGPNYNRIWVVTETVFSMDGDRSPINEIAALTQKYGALLFVDDAHAVGVWGEKGLGLAWDIPQVDLLLGTCGKALGSFGAYVACSQKMKNYLINFCPGFIFTTALPPAVIGATAAALSLIPKLEEQRRAYQQRIEIVRKKIQTLGFDTGPSSTQIIPLILGSEEDTIGLADWLKKNGILATAIRPPTVPDGSARIRLTISLHHTEEQISNLLDALEKWKDEHK